MKNIHWTIHARDKMRFYRLSEGRVRRIINAPKRIETGIAPATIAVMQPASIKTASDKGKPAWKEEIWVMIQDAKSQRKVISAWRYPGVTKPGDPLPEEILREIRNEI